MKKIRTFEFIFIIILGLTPLLWFHGNQVILGHDAGLTLSPVSHFLDRLYAWTERFSFGSDQTYAIAGFFIHGFEALIASFGFNLQTIQKIVFIFWFLLPGLTMYYFASKLAKKLNLVYFVLPATVLYMFNHFLLQGWFVAERTKFSLYAALPLVMAFLFDWEEKKRSTLKTSFLISLTLFVLNGEASLPLFGGLLLSIAVFVIFYFVKESTKDRKIEILKLFISVAIISGFLNAYWLLPYGTYVLQSYTKAVAQAGGLNGVLGWLNYVSQGSSLINIFRLQGIPEWYLNPFHPYASIFLNNIFLIAVSFLIPIAAFSPLYLIKNKESRGTIIFFSFLALFSIIFIAGSHPPFGEIYVFLINFLPGFIAFRNPFYKFAPALWFSYAILMGITINYFLQKLENKKKLLSYGLYFAFSFVVILYSFPFLNGSFFDYIKGQRSTRINNVPQYIYDFEKWSESKNRIDIKVLALPAPNPDNKVDAYTWGYWSLSPLTSLLTNAPVINESSYMSKTETDVIERLYNMIKYNDPGWENYAKLLGINSILLRHDFNWNLEGSPTDNPSVYERALKNSDLTLVRRFGEWDVYDFNHLESQNIYSSDRLAYIEGDVNGLADVSSIPNFNEKITFVSSTIASDPSRVLNNSKSLYISPACILCNIIPPPINQDLYIPTFTPDSIFYPLIKFKERGDELRASKSINSKVNYYLIKSFKDSKGIERVIDEKKSGEAIELAVKEYSSSIKKFESSLETLNKKFPENNDLLIQAYSFLRIESINLINEYPKILDQIGNKDEFNKSFEVLEKSLDLIKNNAWYTNDLVNKKYMVNSPKDDNYTFLINSVSLSDSRVDEGRQISFSLDGSSFNKQLISVGNNWYSLGGVYLSKGFHKLELTDSPQLNLFPKDKQFTIVTDSADKQTCYKSPTIKSRKDDIVRIELEHRETQGSSDYYFVVSQNFKQVPTLTNDGLNFRNSPNWEGLELDYGSTDDNGFYFSICNRIEPKSSRLNSILEVRNISVSKITSPKIIFANIATPSGVEEKVGIKKNSQVDYQINNNGRNNVFVLNESFNRNWVFSASKNKFVANGYANGWILDNSIKHGTIRYSLQNFVVFGFILSLMSLITSIIYLVYKKYA